MSTNTGDIFEQKIEACRHFSLHVAHKIRNPLSALLNVLFQLKKSVAGDDRAGELMLILEEEIWHLKVMSDELALFARKSPDDMSDTDLGDFLKDFRERCIKDCVLFSDATIEIDPPREGLRVKFDQARGAALLESLIFHALVKTDERPKVTLSAGVEDGHAVFSATFAGDCRLNVTPDGMRRIVTSREERVVADLSMALVEHLVNRRGGSIDVSTVDPGFTRITLTL